MTQPCPGYPIDGGRRVFNPDPDVWPWARDPSNPAKSLNPPAHEGGWCCWACDHGWDDADCTCLAPPRSLARLPDPLDPKEATR